ncbi:MAG: ATP-dependent helicase [Lachnospiraceae bacterium]|nr:ATP-dependent helicase [Lachnospiraceae bacterium]
MTYEEFVRKFQIRLNEQQLAAVRSISRPTLVLAVPGSGKTTVLLTRLGYMIYCCGIDPGKILTVTYTVAATKDMQSRFASIFGQEAAERLEFRTINGICAKIIRHFGALAGKEPFELMKDERDKTRLLSEIYREVIQEYATEADLKGLSTWITYIKNMQLTAEELDALSEKEALPLKEIYQAYCSRMRSMARMDYDDQMVYALNILRKSPEVLSHFQDSYTYICVDEAQDTSKIQHRIIALLASRYDNLFMVGDEDQSIYGFRAAYPEALLEFEENHENAQVLLMEENFRSNAGIVEAADRFIQKNVFRHKKCMKAHRKAGADIREVEVKSRRAQYGYLAKVAENCRTETAVLYRDNESILPVIDLLERKGIDYRIKNADLTFFSHKVILDIRNIISFAANPYDTERFMQIYYKIGTYMNKQAAQEACRISVIREMPVLEAALRFGGLPAGTQKSIKSIQTHMEGLLCEPAAQALYRIQKCMGYGDYLELAHISGGKIQILEAIAANEPSALGLVERLQELGAIIQEKKPGPDCQLLFSTIHSSKGLEYDTVYLLDAKDGIFPESVITNRKHASREELKRYEEERRLYYVGVTRAKNNLVIFSFRDGATFTRELLENGTAERKGAEGRAAEALQDSRKSHIGNFKPNQPAVKSITEAAYRDKWEEIMTTGYVKHKIWGEGMLLSADGDDLEIEFAHKTARCRLRFMMEHGMIE